MGPVAVFADGGLESQAPVCPDIAPAGGESNFPREGPPPELRHRPEFGDRPRRINWALSIEFAETSELIGTYKANVSQGVIALLVFGAISVRGKSKSTMETVVRVVDGLVMFRLKARRKTNAELTGPQSVFLLRRYIGPVANRGRAVLEDSEGAFVFCAGAIGIDWSRSNALIT